MRERGYLTPKELKDACASTTGCERDNLDTMLMHPDAKEALLLDPVQKLVSSDDLQPFWKLFPERLQKRVARPMAARQSFSLAQIRKQSESLGDASAFDAELQKQLDAQNTKAKKKDKQIDSRRFSAKTFSIQTAEIGRTRGVCPSFAQAGLRGSHRRQTHPKEEGGCLFITEEIRQAQLNRELPSRQTIIWSATGF